MSRIELTNGQEVLVDDEDFEELNQYIWFPSDKKYQYPRRVEGDRMIYMHREIMGDAEGQISHRNGDVFDNRKSNLIVINTRQRMQKSDRSNMRSKYPGVQYRKDRDSWRSYISINGKREYLGSFKTEEEAFKAYQDACHSIGERLVCEL